MRGPDLTDKTILIVDDDELLRELLRIKLVSVGYRCVEAPDGKQALRTMRREPVDLVIMDMALPMLSGAETAVKMRSDPELSSIPVILLSQMASRDHRRTAQALGVAAFVEKPFCPVELNASVEKILKQCEPRRVRRLRVTVLGSAALAAAVPGVAGAVPMQSAPLALALAASSATDVSNTTAESEREQPPAPDAENLTPSTDLPRLPVVENTPARWGLSLVQTYSWVGDRDDADWHETSVALNRRGDRGTGYTLQMDRSDRFGNVDMFVMLRGDKRLAKRMSGYVALTGTPDADFREKFGVRAGLAAGVARGVELGVDTRLAKYDDGRNLAVTPRASYTIGDNKVILAASYINLFELDPVTDESHRDGYSFRITANPLKRLSVLAGAAQYPEVELGTTRTVTSRYAGATFAMTDNWRISASYADDEYADLFNRQGVSLGLSYRWGGDG